MSHLRIFAASRIDSARNAGLSRLAVRLIRQLRYRCVYPWAARYLFPVPAATKDGLAAFSHFQAFREGAVARTSACEALLPTAEELCHQHFAFLNLPAVDLGSPVDWRFAPGGDRLWQYNLHYGGWALTLAHAYMMSRETRFRGALVELLTDWIEHNPVGEQPGWEPYPLSHRLVAWSRVGLALWDDTTWQVFWRTRLAPSLRQQARVLAANLEHDLANNHLLTNYRALAWVGLLFPRWPEADRSCSLGLSGLWSEMRRQVLADGVHNERSISYHTIVLQDLLETWWLARHVGVPVPLDVDQTILRMLEFLANSQAPDGTWPMVNDSVPDYPIDPRAVLLAGAVLFGRQEWLAQGMGTGPDYLAWLTGETQPGEQVAQKDLGRVAVFPEAGYAVLRDDARNYLFFDAGPMGPRRMPGHGHADALSIVIYGKGRPLIVDPGVYSYQAGPWRDHFRSTASHNTVVVDGEDQCVFWGAFRVAFASQARLTDWSESYLVGEHDGYKRLSRPLLHRRGVERRGPGIWEILDRFEGDGKHDFALTLQFAPGARAEISGSNGEIRWPDGIRLRITCASPPPRAAARIETGWVSRGWNVKHEAPRYVLCWRAKVPVENRLFLTLAD